MLMRWPLFSVQKNGPNDFVLLVASADTQPDAVHDLSLGGGSVKLTVKYGDFSGPLSRVVKALAEVCQRVFHTLDGVSQHDLGKEVRRQ